MTSGLAEALAGEWVGVYELAGTANPLLISWQSEAILTGSLDLPGELVFREPVVTDPGVADRFRCTASPAGRPLLLKCHLRGGRITGTIRQGTRSGSVQLSRLVALDPSLAAAIVGTYALGSDEIVCAGLSGDAPNKFACYSRGDRLVRLYPLSSTELLSYHAELLTVVRDPGGRVTGIRWQEHGREAVLAPRVELYREEEVRFSNGDVTLAGTLLLPPGSSTVPCPAVVLMHGTFPGERNFYRVYAADQFARHGIAALIYDKRGFGASTTGAPSTIAGRAADALAAVGLLQTHPAIRPNQIGLWGFSNSTWSLPMAAAQSGAVAFLIATGAAGVSMASAEIHRRVWELREWSLAEDVLAAIARLWEMAFACMVSGRWEDGWDAEWDDLVKRVHHDEAVAAIPLPDYARSNPVLSPIPPNVSAQTLRSQFTSGAPDMGYDPITDYECVTCPVLFIVGEEDGNVPAHEGARRVEAALARAGNPDYDVQVLPGAAHMLNVAHARVSGMSSGEASTRLHAFRFSPGYPELVSRWILRRTGGAG